MENQEEVDIYNNKKEKENIIQHIKDLEEENQQLKYNILNLGTPEQQKLIDYYFRLRNDFSIELNKLHQQLDTMEAQKKEEQMGQEEKIQNLQLKISQLDNENSEIREKIDTANSELEEKTKEFEKRTVQLQNENNDQKIEELESKLKKLNLEYEKKDEISRVQKENIDELQNQLESQRQNLTEEIDNIRGQYNNLISAGKENEETLNKLYDEKTNNLIKDIEMNKYQLEKKLIHSKNFLNYLEEETNILKNVYENDIKLKDEEIDNLKNNYGELENTYNGMSQMCNEHLNKITENLGQMKQMYLNREKEMVNISKIYVDAMNNYSGSMKDSENSKNILEDDFKTNEELINEFNQKNKELEQELSELKSKKANIGGASVKEISENIETVSEHIRDIETSQNELDKRLKKFGELNNDINKKNSLIDSLTQENRKLVNRNKELEAQKSQIYETNENEIDEIKEKLSHLEQEEKTKDEAIKKYEGMLAEVIGGINIQDEVRTDVLKRLNGQINNLKSQIDKLLIAKDNMENFYMNEMNNLKDKINILANENTELKTSSQSINLDGNIKRKKNYDSWVQESKNLKENAESFSVVDSITNNFSNSCGVIKQIRNYLTNQELIKLKDEINFKNEEIKLLKDTKNTSNTSNNLNAQEILKNFKNKSKIYDSLLAKKRKEYEGTQKNMELISEYTMYKNNLNPIEEKISEEQKNMIENLVKDFKKKNNYNELLEKEIKFLEQKAKNNEELYSNNLLILDNNVNQQISIIKSREDYITKQSEQVINGIKTSVEEKKKMADSLQKEKKQLKDRNYIITTKL